MVAGVWLQLLEVASGKPKAAWSWEMLQAALPLGRPSLQQTSTCSISQNMTSDAYMLVHGCLDGLQAVLAGACCQHLQCYLLLGSKLFPVPDADSTLPQDPSPVVQVQAACVLLSWHGSWPHCKCALLERHGCHSLNSMKLGSFPHPQLILICSNKLT